jgi:Ger(x)C family germination protein
MLSRVAVLIFLTVFPFLAGCWDVEAINRRASVDAIFLDVGNGDKVKLGGSFYIPGTLLPPVLGTEQQFEKRNFIISAEGKSLTEAWSGIQANSVRNVFFGKLRGIVLSEKFAKRDINDFLDFVGRSSILPPNTRVFITQSDPEKLLNMKNNANYLPGNYFDVYFRCPYKKTMAIPITLWQVNEMIDNEVHDPYMPIIEPSQNFYRMAGTALFSHGHMVGKLNVEETQTLAMLKGSTSGYLTVSLDGKVVGYKEVNATSKIVPEIDSKGVVTLSITTNVDGEISEINPRNPEPLTMKDKKELEQRAAAYINGRITKLLDKMRKMDSDPVGFGEKVRIKNPELLKKEKWHAAYPAVSFKVKTNFSINRTGIFR